MQVGNCQDVNAGGKLLNGKIGLNQFGSSGIFSTSSTEVMEIGQIAAGVFYNNQFFLGKRLSSFPLSVGFGIAKGIQADASFASVNSGKEEYEYYAALGFKAGILKNEAGEHFLSAYFQLTNQKISADNNNVHDLMSYSIKAIASYKFFERISTYVHIGYLWSGNKIPGIKNRMVEGAGLSVSLNDYLLAAAELFTLEKVINAEGFEGRLGIKLFLLEHFQFAVGIQGTRKNKQSSGGVFLGISFSSEELRTDYSIDNDAPSILPEPPPLEEILKTDTTKTNDVNKI